MGSNNTVEHELHNGCLILTLNRPEVHNALNLEMFDGLHTHMERAGQDRGVRTILLRGAGPSFSSGDDLRGMGTVDHEAPTLDQELALGHPRLIRAMRALEKPIIASLHGWVLGAGCEVALSADIRVGDPSVKLGIPYISRAMAGGAAVVLEIFGVSIATDMLLTGRTFELSELLRFGAVQREAPEGKSFETALALTETLDGFSSKALGLTKMTLSHHWDLSVRPRVAVDNYVAMVAAEGEDQTQSVERFLTR